MQHFSKISIIPSIYLSLILSSVLNPAWSTEKEGKILSAVIDKYAGLLEGIDTKDREAEIQAWTSIVEKAAGEFEAVDGYLCVKYEKGGYTFRDAPLTIAAVAEAARVRKLPELIPVLIPYSDIMLDEDTSYFFNTNLSPQEHVISRLQNRPVLFTIVSLGKDSIEPLEQYFAAQTEKELQPLESTETRRLLGLIAVLSNIKAAHGMNPLDEDKIWTQLKRLKGDEGIVQTAKLIWELEVEWEHEFIFSSAYRKNPNQAIRWAQGKCRAPLRMVK